LFLYPPNNSSKIKENGSLFTYRSKTQINSNIPLIPPALEIIERYKDHPLASNKRSLLPIYSNQRLNTYLKEIADICGISKNLSFHIARHTFATTITLSNDVPIETVSKMLGHGSLRTTQIYAKVVERKVSHDMDKLMKKFSNPSPEPYIPVSEKETA
jgi:site-specific recombinase XerD